MDMPAIYERMAELREGQVRMEGKLDMALTRLDDHSHRLRAIERFRWIVVGGAMLLGFLIAARENLGKLLKML